MAELLRLAAGKLADLIARQVLAHRSVDIGRLYEVVARQLEVAVVLHHADELDVGNRATVELAELGLGERARELERAIAAKIVEHDSANRRESDRSDCPRRRRRRSPAGPGRSCLGSRHEGV